jgi:hypothetical protein
MLMSLVARIGNGRLLTDPDYYQYRFGYYNAGAALLMLNH